MPWLHGARHDPEHPALMHARPLTVGAKAPVDWFESYPPTGNMLANTELSDCCEAADLVLVEWCRAALGLDPIPPDELTELVKLRYRQIAGWDGGMPGNDPGSIPQWDCASWQAAGIVAGGRVWNATWHSVAPADVTPALAEAPLLLTLALDAASENDPFSWGRPHTGDPVGFHRVLAGTVRRGLLICRTYGFDVPVSPDRVVAADLMRFA